MVSDKTNSGILRGFEYLITRLHVVATVAPELLMRPCSEFKLLCDALAVYARDATGLIINWDRQLGPLGLPLLQDDYSMYSWDQPYSWDDDPAFFLAFVLDQGPDNVGVDPLTDLLLAVPSFIVNRAVYLT